MVWDRQEGAAEGLAGWSRLSAHAQTRGFVFRACFSFSCFFGIFWMYNRCSQRTAVQIDEPEKNYPRRPMAALQCAMRALSLSCRVATRAVSTHLFAFLLHASPVSLAILRLVLFHFREPFFANQVFLRWRGLDNNGISLLLACPTTARTTLVLPSPFSSQEMLRLATEKQRTAATWDP